MAWIGSIALNDNTVLQDVRLTATSSNPMLAIPQETSLKFLSIVETARISYLMTLGASCKVTTSSGETQRWMSSVFASEIGEAGIAWWEGARPDSPLGVLVAIEHDGRSNGNEKGTRATELLLYASRSQTVSERLPTPPPSSLEANGEFQKDTPTLSIHALPLCSDLLQAAEAVEPTPPTSPIPANEDVEAVFLLSFPAEEEIINEPPVRKRRSAADAFDEATERRRKARRRGGEGVIAAAAATKTECQLASLKHGRSVSNTEPVPLQTRPLSRSPSIASSRPPTAIAQAGKKSSLSQVQSTVEPNATDVKNKDFVSRIVMAGMRLYGLSQSKSRSKTKAEYAAPSPAMDVGFDDLEADRKNDDEFKLIYHQVYKATCFAFRASVGEQTLQPFAGQVRDIVDRLLAVFCSDPLAQGLQGVADEITPGGRRAFGSRNVAEEKIPFCQVVGERVDVSTPRLRRNMSNDR